MQVSASQVSRVSQGPKEKTALWDVQETLDSKDQMDAQDFQDKMDHQDPKVIGVWMVNLVLLV